MSPSRAALLVVAVPLATPSLGQEKLFGRMHEMLPLEPNVGGDLGAADVDGDGDLDLLLGNAVDPDVLYLNEGNGVFAHAVGQLPAALTRTDAVALGDLNGNGTVDAVLGNDLGSDTVWLGDGAGTFTELVGALPPFVPSPFDIGLGDVDDDGDLDAYFAEGDPYEFPPEDRLLRNDGSATFTEDRSSIPFVDNMNTFDVELVDVDVDGDLDALLAGFYRNDVLTNDGSGLFAQLPGAFPMIFDFTTSFDAGDVDGDGDPDVVATTGPFFNDSDPARLYENDGSGIFAQAPFPAVGNDGREALLVDVDGDADLDAFLGTYGQDLLFLNDGSGSFSDATAMLLPAREDSSVAARAGDFDADGDADIVLVNFSQQPDRLLLGDGSGAFADVRSAVPFRPTFAVHAFVADLDGDTHPDAVTSDFEVFLNDGLGYFELSGTPGPVASFTHVVGGADVEGDGDVDLVFGTGRSFLVEKNRLFLNDGAAGFTDVSDAQLPGDPDEVQSLAFGDVDDDGDVDLLLGRGHDGACLLSLPNILMKNDGAGTFTDVTGGLSLPEGDSQGVAFGDLDQDGDLDFLVGNGEACTPQQNRLFLNDGTGVFQNVTATHLPALLDRTTDVALGDLDGDGDLDAAVANDIDEPNRILLNEGGVLSDAGSALPAHGDRTRSVAVADFDEDGDLDLFFGNGTNGNALEGTDRFYTNDGSAQFTDALDLFLQVPTTTESLAVGDLDRDGDLDGWAVAKNQGSRIFSNLRRHLAWRNEASLGKTLELALYGPAAEPWVLFFATSTASIELGPTGTLLLNPFTLAVAGAGNLDGGGGASVALPVPSNPAFLGLSIYWQAAVGLVPRLTNADVTPLTQL